MKLTPLALLPPIAARRWRDGAVTVGVFVGAGALAWIVVPHESVQYWFHELPGGWYGQEALVGNQSLAGLLARYPLPGPPAFTTLVVVTAMAAILVEGSWRAVGLARRGAGLPAFVVASCTGLLLAPVSWTHHQTPVLLAAMCASLATGRATTLLRGLVVVVMCVNLSAVHLPILGTVLGESRLLLFAYLALMSRYQLLHPSTRTAPSGTTRSDSTSSRHPPQPRHPAPTPLCADDNQEPTFGHFFHRRSTTRVSRQRRSDCKRVQVCLCGLIFPSKRVGC